MFARFQLGDADLVLFPADKLAEVVGLPIVTGEGFKGSASAMILDGPEALDAVLGEVRLAGGTVLGEPADRPWGPAPRTSPTPRATPGSLPASLPDRTLPAVSAKGPAGGNEPAHSTPQHPAGGDGRAGRPVGRVDRPRRVAQ
jgi:hypothetical protein